MGSDYEGIFEQDRQDAPWQRDALRHRCAGFPVVDFPTLRFSTHVAVSLCFVAFYTICIVIYAVCSREESVVYRLPKVRAIERESSRLIFLLEKNDLFSSNTLVTIAYQNEDIEIETILGLGRVEAINTQGCAQVVFFRESNNARAKKIIAGLTNIRRDRVALRCKPSVTMDLINGGFVEEYEDAKYFD